MAGITDKLGMGASTSVPQNQNNLESDDGDSCKEVSRRVAELNQDKALFGSRGNPSPQGRPPNDSGVRRDPAEPLERKGDLKISAMAKKSCVEVKPEQEKEAEAVSSAHPKKRQLTPEEEAAIMKWAAVVFTGGYFYY